MRLFAPAKINLHLRVGPPRGDGFHPILSWMCTVGLFDEIEIGRAGGAEIQLTCDDATIPTDERNLIVRAARAIQPPGEHGLRIHLTKRIPAGGGLAGGSSDAARTLIGLNHLWTLRKSTNELAAIAARLGSDIAFFFFGPSSVCAGLGEIVRPISPPRPRWAVLIFPPFGMPTPAVYRRFDEMKLGRAADIERQPDWVALTQLPSVDLLPHLVNDLEAPAFDMNPALGKLRGEWEHRLCRIVRMSGSGSTLFTLYDTKEESDSAAAQHTGLRVVQLAPEFQDAATGPA
ncbi:MAG: 4-(cytidine 5'-diphospho)-2-C-methyl-D-erythritol kinase [Tepidisphaeraceae bacterium]|jgi:4-diphosphocytidyl-2-C-methyl-D-erythritol kinase